MPHPTLREGTAIIGNTEWLVELQITDGCPEIHSLSHRTPGVGGFGYPVDPATAEELFVERDGKFVSLADYLIDEVQVFGERVAA